MQDYEKLGAFYLGREVSPKSGEVGDELILYDSRDLTTHGVCVGMTGSGKTGLCVSLIEEAAIDGIPVLAIDPKGDLGNLMLTFPDLSPRDFEPWIDEGDALRKGLTPAELATKTAALWRKGLAEWGQEPDRIRKLKESADFAIYTPGSQAGLPLSVLRSLSAPPAAMLDDGEAMADRIQSATSGLLGLLGVDADPIRSREHILVSNILRRAWEGGRDLDLAQLIREIQTPPFERVGVFDLEAFFPGGDRLGLAMQINNLLASPTFGSWMEGEPLDVERLLYARDGKPRVSIFSIAHLSEDQRMFFVTLLLNEIVAWMRTQSGTSSLRALVYMDEVFGYLPPTANPPSKKPLLTLLKQARAFGVGCLLATQNPVDLDYKALSNAGTWFLGRLQTERDKARVLDGLEGASASAGVRFDRQATEAVLSGLKGRVFLMNNVHEDEPVVFHSRWALSYLRGPLTRSQIQVLMKERAATVQAASPAETAPAKASLTPPKEAPGESFDAGPPPLPQGIDSGFLSPNADVGSDQGLLYRPALLAEARVHFVSSKDDLDAWDEVALVARLDEDNEHDPWEAAEVLSGAPPSFGGRGEPSARFASLPRTASRGATWTGWERELKGYLYRTQERKIWTCKALKESSRPGESEGQFRVRLGHAARESRDLEIEKLRKRYAPKLTTLEERVRRAEQRVEVEKSQHKHQKFQTTISFGSTILGALFGRKKISAGNLGRAAGSVKSMGRVAREAGDVDRAEETLEATQSQLAEMESEFQATMREVQARFDAENIELSQDAVSPRKSDIVVSRLMLVWTPWLRGSRGQMEPLFELGASR